MANSPYVAADVRGRVTLGSRIGLAQLIPAPWYLATVNPLDGVITLTPKTEAQKKARN